MAALWRNNLVPTFERSSPAAQKTRLVTRASPAWSQILRNIDALGSSSPMRRDAQSKRHMIPEVSWIAPC